MSLISAQQRPFGWVYVAEIYSFIFMLPKIKSDRSIIFFYPTFFCSSFFSCSALCFLPTHGFTQRALSNSGCASLHSSSLALTHCVVMVSLILSSVVLKVEADRISMCTWPSRVSQSARHIDVAQQMYMQERGRGRNKAEGEYHFAYLLLFTPK